MDFGSLQSHIHGMVVHFPIALLFSSVALELLALYKPWQDKLRAAALATLILGTLGAAASVMTGPDEMLRASPIGHTHENFADLTLITFGLLSLWRIVLLIRKRSMSTAVAGAYLVLCCVGLGLLGYTGYLGGSMVYDQAVGVRTNGQLVVPVPAHRAPGK
jgi:uncharacterized membrane protein